MCIIILKEGRVQRPDAVFVWLRSDMLTKILTGSTGNGLKNLQIIVFILAAGMNHDENMM